jgi:hypothetical protein
MNTNKCGKSRHDGMVTVGMMWQPFSMQREEVMKTRQMTADIAQMTEMIRGVK